MNRAEQVRALQAETARIAAINAKHKREQQAVQETVQYQKRKCKCRKHH